MQGRRISNKTHDGIIFPKFQFGSCHLHDKSCIIFRRCIIMWYYLLHVTSEGKSEHLVGRSCSPLEDDVYELLLCLLNHPAQEMKEDLLRLTESLAQRKILQRNDKTSLQGQRKILRRNDKTSLQGQRENGKIVPGRASSQKHMKTCGKRQKVMVPGN